MFIKITVKRRVRKLSTEGRREGRGGEGREGGREGGEGGREGGRRAIQDQWLANHAEETQEKVSTPSAGSSQLV